MIQEIFAGLFALMLFGACLYCLIKYINGAFKKEQAFQEKREKLVDLMIDKYSVSTDTENKK